MFLEMSGITKQYPGVLALDDVKFGLEAGEVHVILGENGAGKSTLMKILSGNCRADKGNILINGENVKIPDPHSAQKLGISMIHQELMMVESVEVYKNIMLGREPYLFAPLGVINKNEMRKESDRVLNGDLQANIDVDSMTDSLSVAQKQLVEIAKTISTGAQIIIMDEPTSSLPNKDIKALFNIIAKLKKRGTAIIYITHKMEEIKQIADRVTIMRDGRYVDTVNAAETSIETMIRLMVGRDLVDKYPKEEVQVEEVLLEVKNLSAGGMLENISFYARKGEVLGIYGLIGAGRTELAKAIFGEFPITSGEIWAFGKKIRNKSPKEAIKNKIGLVPEDRKLEGLVSIMSVSENITLPIIDKIKRAIFVHRGKQKEIAAKYKDAMNIKTPHLNFVTRNLSGGNQQKVVIAKWLASGAEIIILDEPTRGIDVGAKVEIYKIINQLKKQGSCVIMISSEIPELLGVSGRVIVMKEGRISKELTLEQATQEEILKWAL